MIQMAYFEVYDPNLFLRYTYHCKLAYFNRNTKEKQTFEFLAHLVMSLCNHALSIMCHCHCCHHHWHLCTALPVTGLIIEASYLTNICSYAPSICT